MNNYSLTYSLLSGCENHKVFAKYVMNNLVMCENRVNTHILIARILQNIF